MDVVEHYDKLIDENNDPVYDPEPLKRYMDKWDGQIFIDAMELNKNKVVLGSPKVWKMCRTFSLLVMV